MYRVNHGYTWTEHETMRAAFKAAYHATRLEYRISKRMIPALCRITRDGHGVIALPPWRY